MFFHVARALKDPVAPKKVAEEIQEQQQFTEQRIYAPIDLTEGEIEMSERELSKRASQASRREFPIRSFRVQISRP